MTKIEKLETVDIFEMGVKDMGRKVNELIDAYNTLEEGVDLGEANRCNSCDERICKCENRRKDGSWGFNREESKEECEHPKHIICEDCTPLIIKKPILSEEDIEALKEEWRNSSIYLRTRGGESFQINDSSIEDYWISKIKEIKK